MAEKVGEIYYEVGADIAPLLQGSTQANAALDAMGKGASKASGNLENLEKSAQKTSKAVVRSADDATSASKIMESLGNEVAILEEKQQKGARAAVILAAELRAGASATQAQRKEIGMLAGELFDLKQAQDQANAAQQKSTDIMGGLKTGLTSIASAIAISQLVQYGKQFLEIADTMTQLQARIDRLSSSAQEGAATFQALSSIASASGSSLKDTEKLWETLTSSLKNAGASNAQILTLTDTLQKIGRIGGSSTEEMANALRQFGQSIAGGTVRAEEFNSIIEQMPELARQIAAGLGISVGELRKRMLEGKLSAEDALNAIMKQTGLVNDEFSKLPRTVDQATNSLTISFQELVKQINDTTGASTGMVHVIDSITAAIDRLAGRVPNATQQISDLNSTADMFARRARTYSFLGLDGWAAQAEGINAVSNKAALLVGDLASISKANASASNQPIKIAGTGDSKEAAKLEKSTKRKLELSKLEGEARARLQAQYDAEDAGITDSKRIKALQDEYAATEKNTSARKSSTAEGKKSASQAEADAQKLEVLRQKSEQVADSTQELSRSNAILQAQQSLSKSVTADQIKQAGDYATKIWDQANAFKAKQQAEQASRFSDQQKAAADVAVNPYTGEATNPAAQVELEQKQKLAAVAKYEAMGAMTEQQAQDTRTAIVKQGAYARMQIVKDEAQKQVDSMNTMLGGFQAGFEGLANIIARGAGESSSAYKALFAVSKGFAIAQAGLNLQLAISNAMASGPFPWNLANMAQVAAAGGQVVSAIGGASYGGAREHGGPVNASSMYRVGEGGKPEIFKASNGSQYMIPGDNGSVISNRDLGGGSGGGVIEQHNYFTIHSTTGDPEELTKQIAQISYQQSLRAMKDQQRPGGMLTQRK